MQYQLRTYRVKTGEMEQWLEEWRSLVLPLRRRFGFEVVGAWVIEEEDRFLWIVGYDGDFSAQDRAYYESDERNALDPDPARHLAGTETHMMTSVMPS